MAKLAAYHTKGKVEAGCDEAGRGCLAGPVVAAAVILPQSFHHEWLNDSKQLTEKQRNKLRPIIEGEAVAWAVASVSAQEIDAINILQASFLAMHRAIEQLTQRPDVLLIDGNRFKSYQDIAHHCIVKGDAKYRSIAAASILAKTHRDEKMLVIHDQFPDYGWNRNKGYPTADHRSAILTWGSTAQHRQTFRLLPEQLKLDL